MIKIKKQSAGGFAWALCCALGLLLCCASVALPQVALDSSGYIFLHPFFNGKSWKATLATTDISLPDTLTFVRPKHFDIGPRLDSTTALFSTQNGKLFSMFSYFDHFTGSCLTDLITFDKPHSISLTGIAFTAATPWYLIKDSASAFDSIRIACTPSALQLLVFTVRPATGVVTRIDTCILSNSGRSQQPLTIMGDNDTLTHQDKGLWVLGTNGLARYFAINGPHQFGSESVRDLAGTDTVRCTYGAFCGTSSGKIYRLNASNAFVLETTLPQTINAIVKRGAIGKNGLVAEYTNNSWRAYTKGAASGVHPNFTRRSKGLGVEILDTNWYYHVYSFRDTISQITNVLPASLAANIDDMPYFYRGDSVQTIKLIVHDPDSNYSDLSLSLNNGLDLKSDSVHAFDTLPDTLDCRPGSLRLASDTIVLTLSRDSIKAAYQCDLGAVNVSCLFPYWKKFSFIVKNSWHGGTMLTVAAGTNRFYVQYQISIAQIRQYPAAKAMLRIVQNKYTHSLQIDAPAGMLPRLETVLVYNACGRIITRLELGGSTHQIVRLPQQSTILFGKLLFSDGSSRTMPIPLIR